MCNLNIYLKLWHFFSSMATGFLLCLVMFTHHLIQSYIIVPSLQMPLSSVHKKVQTSTSAYQRQQHQYIYCHCQLGHVTSGCAILVAVCIFMLPMLEVAAEHKQLTTTHHNNPVYQCGGNVTFSHSPLVLPSLKNVLPAMVLQNRAVRSNMHLSHSLYHSSVCHVFFSLGLGVPPSLKKVVGVVVVLLLLLSGDIETNPGPDSEYS